MDNEAFTINIEDDPTPQPSEHLNSTLYTSSRLSPYTVSGPCKENHRQSYFSPSRTPSSASTVRYPAYKIPVETPTASSDVGSSEEHRSVYKPSARPSHIPRRYSGEVESSRRYRSLPDDIGFNRKSTKERILPFPEPFTLKCGNCQTKKKELSENSDLSWRRLHMSLAKLRSTSSTSELLAGFAMVALVELQINDPTQVPEWLFVVFSVCTTVLVAVHVFALMISTYLLPNIDAISKMNERGLVDESPHERMWHFIELAWTFSTVLGLFLFLVEIVVICWVKFWDFSFRAAWASTIVVVPVLVIFVGFVLYFSNTMRVNRVEQVTSKMKELEEMKQQLDLVQSYGSSTA